MRRIIPLTSLICCFLLAATAVAAPPHWPAGVEPPPLFAPNRVLVGFEPGTSGLAMSEAHRQAGGNVIQTLDAIGVQVVAVPEGTVLDKIAAYHHNPNVLFAEPNYRRYIYLPATNEGSEPTIGIANNYTEQWGLENTGQAFGVTVDPLFGTLILGAYQGVLGADISAPDGWELVADGAAMAGSGTKIAIIDSGIDCTHPDLMSGGASKCVEQINFVSVDVPLDDIIGHGTHVATIAAAYSHNGVGTAGVAGGAFLGALKVCYAELYLGLFIVGVCEDAAIADAILYAACPDGVPACDAPYHVINMSLAGPENSATIESAVNIASSAGVVIVAAAGNNYTQTMQYPAAYLNVMAVAATDYFDNLASFSSFGPEWVTMAAPGHTIFSAVPNAGCGDPPEGCYDWLSGTSMSTPMVAGAAAVVWAHQGGSATNVSVRAALENGADVTGILGQNMQAWVQHGRLNLASALAAGGPAPTPLPSQGTIHVGDLDGVSSAEGSSWRATVASSPGVKIPAISLMSESSMNFFMVSTLASS